MPPGQAPGDEYQRVNTQLFGIIDPPSNRGVPADQMVAPYNAPPGARSSPTMDGFVADYISTFLAELGRDPTYDEFAQIMTGYVPEQVPVFSALARGFATFDRWFCEVPSQTFANRSFFHAATSSGFVNNASPPDAFPLRNSAETIFERLDQRSLSWRVYCDPPSQMSLTGVLHAPRLWRHFPTKFVTPAACGAPARAGKVSAAAGVHFRPVGRQGARYRDLCLDLGADRCQR